LEGQHHQEALCGQSFAQTVQYGAEVIARRWLAKGKRHRGSGDGKREELTQILQQIGGQIQARLKSQSQKYGRLGARQD
jgi:hypothetical protein